MRLLGAILFCVLLTARVAAAGPLGPVLQAMQQELKKAAEGLNLRDYPSPYFIAYSARRTDRCYVLAKFGAVFKSHCTPDATIDVDVRVGSYFLDSSEDRDYGFGSTNVYVPTNIAPAGLSAFALRRALWLMTDFKYKNALASYFRVKAKGVRDPERRKVGSMTREEPLVLVEKERPLKFDLQAWTERARNLSKVFVDYDRLLDAAVEVSGTRLVRYFVNTEGTRVRSVDFYYYVVATGVTRADDGQLLTDSLTIYGRSVADLPGEKGLFRRVRKMLDDLMHLRRAEKLDPVTVPVIMSPEATGVFFHETVGHRLEGQRQEKEEEGKTFRGRVGQQILPNFIDVYDDPTLTEFRGIPLNGHYREDDEGVEARRAVLVEGGVLKGFLMSRKPIEGFDESNGHGRSDGIERPVGRMGTLVIRGRAPVSHERLEQMLLEEVRKQGKPYGLIIVSMSGGSTNTTTYGYQAFKGIPRIAYRVDAKTGERKLVRGFEIVGTPLSSIGKIVATSDRYGVFNGYCGAESGSIPVSTIAPEMLFKEMELQRSTRSRERMPILPPPRPR